MQGILQGGTVLIQINEVTGEITFLSPRTKRPICKMIDGQLVLQEGHGVDKMFHYLPIPLLTKADGVMRRGVKASELESELGVVVK